MLHRLKIRAESFDNWSFKVKTALDAAPDQKLGELELTALKKSSSGGSIEPLLMCHSNLVNDRLINIVP